MTRTLPYRIAVLCYLHDDRGRILMLHRGQEPNLGLYSPIGGKLDVDAGESPHDCAIREIREEAGVVVSIGDLRLAGTVAETAYEGQKHWLIFLFEVTRPIAPDEIASMTMSEGTLEWLELSEVLDSGIPETDRRILWPLMREHQGGFFAVHIDCSNAELSWTVQETRGPSG